MFGCFFSAFMASVRLPPPGVFFFGPDVMRAPPVVADGSMPARCFHPGGFCGSEAGHCFGPVDMRTPPVVADGIEAGHCFHPPGEESPP